MPLPIKTTHKDYGFDRYLFSLDDGSQFVTWKLQGRETGFLTVTASQYRVMIGSHVDLTARDTDLFIDLLYLANYIHRQLADGKDMANLDFNL